MATPDHKLRFWGCPRHRPVAVGVPSALRRQHELPRRLVERSRTYRPRLRFGSAAIRREHSAQVAPVCRHASISFLSHYHFDHVEGLPLFMPLYDPHSTIPDSRSVDLRDGGKTDPRRTDPTALLPGDALPTCPRRSSTSTPADRRSRSVT